LTTSKKNAIRKKISITEKKEKRKRKKKRKKSKKKRNRKRKKTKKKTKKKEGEDETHEEVGVDEHEADSVQLIWHPSGLIFGTGRFEPHYVASNKAKDSMSDEIGLSDQNPFDRSWYTAAR